ncbi:imidazolonepropionase [Liquorilactobacillus uvarum]|uniref:imidazolonepropionase n=1 Tax=Liquorilactobacillus uvarum TaxID=303240 RepID=UPI00070B269A|nr:imidazolonepropionase [Liquorilactobacillus uvarum]
MTNLLIVHADQIATPTGQDMKRGSEMNEISIINDGAIYVEDELIVSVGKTDEVLAELRRKNITKFDQVIDSTGSAVIPGLIDSHTHFLYAGYRLNEFYERVSGSSYMQIMQNGGGIQATVDATREVTYEKLKQLGLQRLNEMIEQGVTTVEGKSGYGLDQETEIRQLRVLQELNLAQPLDIAVTYLGAHAVPPEFQHNSEEYLNLMIDEILPQINEEKLAEFVDVFCDEGVFDYEQSQKLLEAAKKLGFKVKMHADEIANLNGAGLAANIEATSADHLIKISSEEIAKLSEKKKTVATLLPCTAFCLQENFAPARELIDNGCAVALASDYNPGSSFTCSIPLIIALASFKMKMTMGEVLTALTLNGAAAVNAADKKGSIEAGKVADLVLLKYPDYRYLMYNTGSNIVKKVIKSGKSVFEK